MSVIRQFTEDKNAAPRRDGWIHAHVPLPALARTRSIARMFAIASASGVGIRVDADSLPIDPGARDWWTSRGIDPVIAAISGGDDYELLCAVAPRSGGAMRMVSRQVADPPLTKIGVFTKDPRERVIARGGKNEALPEGFEHFAHR